MRTGFNPNKDKALEQSVFVHQVIIPVYLPNLDGYFKESLDVLKLCLQSVIATTHEKTFITVVNNGSCGTIRQYLQDLLDSNAIHEVVHTHNIGKLNAIVKGIAGTHFELVTIADADVLFLPGWQEETLSIFRQLPKVGVVGIVPQFNLHKVNSSNLICDNLFNSKLRFDRVKDKKALQLFYESLGWDDDYNQDYLEYSLSLKWNEKTTVLVGSGHFVATYKRNILDDIPSFSPYKMGGYSEGYLDSAPLKRDYWRVTTNHNFAYHIGNSIEKWMLETDTNPNGKPDAPEYGFAQNKPLSKVGYFFKVRLAQALFRQKGLYKRFLKWKKLPKAMVRNY